MQVQQLHLKQNLDLAALAPLGKLQPGLVLVFGGHRFFEDGQLGVKLKSVFPNSVIAGCSSAGEIINQGEVHDDTLVVTALTSTDSEFFSAMTTIANAADSHRTGETLGHALSAGQIKSVLLLAPGLNVNGSDLANGIAAALGPDITVTGGLAGDGGRFQQTYTLCNDQVASDMVVAIGMKGAGLHVSYGSQGGWEPFGLERRVTRAVSNVLYELDGRPALQLYKEYLGDKAAGLPRSGLFYPFLVLDDSTGAHGLTRTLLNIDEAAGSLIMAGDIPEGSVVRLMHAKTGGLLNGAARASQDALTGEPAGNGQTLGLLISCVGRKLVMGTDIDEEILAVKENFGPDAVVAGFYSYGEICAMDKTNRHPRLQNQTMTITRLSGNA